MNYPKIPHPFKRDPQTHVLDSDTYSSPEIEMLRHVPWVGTEKIDGMNLHLQWNGDSSAGMGVKIGHAPLFFGRTEYASLPQGILDWFFVCFPSETLRSYFFDITPENPLNMYFEGVGPGIQKHGHLYSKNHKGILLDISIGKGGDAVWLNRESLEDCATNLGLDLAPVVFDGTLYQAVDGLRTDRGPWHSSFNEQLPIEGLVLQPAVPLRDRMGNRIITKLRVADVKRMLEPTPPAKAPENGKPKASEKSSEDKLAAVRVHMKMVEQLIFN